MEQNPVGWFEINVKDMQRAKAFYEAVLAVPVQKLDSPDPKIEMWTFPMHQHGSGAAGALVKMDGAPSNGNSTIVYFSCADCATEAGRVSSSGGKVVKEKTAIGQYGFIALAADPEGNVIGLHSMK